jgi:hypothetical protein
MTVRDTTAWKHAIIQKKIINHDSGVGRHIVCAWLDCEKEAYELYKVVTHIGSNGFEDKTMTYAFCSEKCKQYWLHDSRGGGGNNLPSGYRAR